MNPETKKVKKINGAFLFNLIYFLFSQKSGEKFHPLFA